MERRRILLLTAVVVAVLGTALVFVYVRGADDRAADQFDTVEVLKAVVVIEPGESIEDALAAGKVALDPVAQADMLPTAQTGTEGLAGLVATTRIYPGEQIITEKFGAAAEAAASPLTIPKGMLAVSVNLADTARVAGFVNPGSEVALFLSGSDPASGESFTRLLLPRVTVIAVGSTTPTATTTTQDGTQTTEQLPRTLMTLALNQLDAQRVLFAAGHGEIAFGLLTETSTVRPDPGITAGDLFQ